MMPTIVIICSSFGFARRLLMSAGKYMRLPSASPLGQKRSRQPLVDDEHARAPLGIVAR